MGYNSIDSGLVDIAKANGFDKIWRVGVYPYFGVSKNWKSVIVKYDNSEMKPIMPAAFKYIDRFHSGSVGPHIAWVTQGPKNNELCGYMSLPFKPNGIGEDLIYTIGIVKDGNGELKCQLSDVAAFDNSQTLISVPMSNLTDVGDYMNEIETAYMQIEHSNDNIDGTYELKKLKEMRDNKLLPNLTLNDYKNLVAGNPAYEAALRYIAEYGGANDTISRTSLFEDNNYIKKPSQRFLAYLERRGIHITCWKVEENGDWKDVGLDYVFEKQAQKQ